MFRKISALHVKNLSDEEDIRSLDVLLMLNYPLICLFFKCPIYSLN